MDQTSSVLWRGRKGGTNVRALFCVGTVTLGALIISLLLPNLAASSVATTYKTAVQTVFARSGIVPYTTSIPHAVTAIHAARAAAIAQGTKFVAGPTPVRFVEDVKLIASAVKENPTRQAYARGFAQANARVISYVASIPKAVSTNSAVKTALAFTAPKLVTADTTDFFEDPIFEPVAPKQENGDPAKLPEIADKPAPKRITVTRPVSIATAQPFEPQNSTSTGGDVARTFTGSFSAYTSRVEETDASPFTSADGTTTYFGMAANNCLPFGTRLRFPNLFGDKVFVVHDRMSSRYGCSKVDVWLPTYGEAIQFGVRTSLVEVLK